MRKKLHYSECSSVIVKELREKNIAGSVDQCHDVVSGARRGSSGSPKTDVRASFSQSAHPFQERLQLVSRERRPHELISRKDNRLSIDNRHTLERVRRYFADDLERILVEPELQLSWNRPPERSAFLKSELSDLQFVIRVADILLLSTHLKPPDVVVEDRILRRSLGGDNACRRPRVARQAAEREASIRIDDVGVGAEEVEI